MVLGEPLMQHSLRAGAERCATNCVGRQFCALFIDAFSNGMFPLIQKGVGEQTYFVTWIFEGQAQQPERLRCVNTSQ